MTLVFCLSRPSIPRTFAMKKNIALSGNIDEDFSIPAEDVKDATEINIDFSKVKKINSFGIREFIYALEAIPKKVNINYLNCPPLFVHQLNIVEGLLPSNANVRSLNGLFFCPICHKETLHRMEEPFNPETVEKNLTCPDDSSPLEFFYNKESFFKFLER
jgi:hypothetical protein